MICRYEYEEKRMEEQLKYNCCDRGPSEKSRCDGYQKYHI